MPTLREDLERLAGLDTGELRIEWRQQLRSEPPASLSRDMLVRAIAFALQERAHGGLSRTAKRMLHAFATTPAADPGRSSLTIIKPGVRLMREWHGEVHSVVALEDGFEYRDQRYRSLTEIAKIITGAHWSGPRFFAGPPAKPSRPPPAASSSPADGAARDHAHA